MYISIYICIHTYIYLYVYLHISACIYIYTLSYATVHMAMTHVASQLLIAPSRLANRLRSMRPTPSADPERKLLTLASRIYQAMSPIGSNWFKAINKRNSRRIPIQQQAPNAAQVPRRVAPGWHLEAQQHYLEFSAMSCALHVSM